MRSCRATPSGSITFARARGTDVRPLAAVWHDGWTILPVSVTTFESRERGIRTGRETGSTAPGRHFQNQACRSWGLLLARGWLRNWSETTSRFDFEHEDRQGSKAFQLRSRCFFGDLRVQFLSLKSRRDCGPRPYLSAFRIFSIAFSISGRSR